MMGQRQRDAVAEGADRHPLSRRQHAGTLVLVAKRVRVDRAKRLFARTTAGYDLNTAATRGSPKPFMASP